MKQHTHAVKSILLFFVLFCVAIPLAALADYQTLPPGPQTKEEFLAVFDKVLNWVFTFFVITAIVFILFAAFQFVTAGGEPEKMAEARQKLIWAGVGIIVALLAKGFPLVIRNILGA